MGVMKPLFLLCVVSAACIDNVQGKDNRENNSIHNFDPRILKGEIQQKKVFLNQNGNPMVSKSALKEVFSDVLCEECIECMERAIKAHRVHTLITSLHPSGTADELYTADNVPFYQRDSRYKRDEFDDLKNLNKTNKGNHSRGFNMHTEIISTISKVKLNSPETEYFQLNETKLRVLTYKNKTTHVKTSESTCRLYKVLDVGACESGGPHAWKAEVEHALGHVRSGEPSEQSRQAGKVGQPKFATNLLSENHPLHINIDRTTVSSKSEATTTWSWIDAIVNSEI